MTTSGYDGSISIDTKINSSGFNRGVTSISGSLTRLSASLKKIGTTLLKVFSAGTLLAFGASLAQIVKSIRESMTTLFKASGGGVVAAVEDLKNGFSELQLAIANAFLPLMLAAIPYIKTTIAWLTELFNKISMIAAAWLGQKQVLQVISGSAATLAKNTEKAKKAAQGAMAAFDQINVLDTNSPEAAAPDLTAMTEMVPVTQDVFDLVERIKESLADWQIDPMGSFADWAAETKITIDNLFHDIWVNFTDWAAETKIKIDEFFRELWKNFADWAAEKINNINEWFTTAWENIKRVAREVWANIKQAFLDAWEAMKEKVKNVWKDIAEIWGLVVDWFTSHVLDPLSEKFKRIWAEVKDRAVEAWDRIKERAGDAKEWIMKIWNTIVDWVRLHVSDPIMNAFGDALDWVQAKFEDVFSGIKKFVKGIINNIIDFLNGMIDGVLDGINSIIDGANLIGNIIPGYSPISYLDAPRIPHLATGAVIPPNAKFAAVLGDQRSGVNIESPVSLMKETFEDSLSKALANQNITINFTGSLSELVRTLHPEIIRENNRIGGSLIKGGVV